MADINFVGAADKPDVFLGDNKTGTLDDGSTTNHIPHSGHLSDAEEKLLSKAYLKLDAFFLTSITIIYWLNFLGELNIYMLHKCSCYTDESLCSLHSDRANIGNARAAGKSAPLLSQT